MAYPYNRIVFSNKRNELLDTCNNMDEYQTNYIQKKNSDKK